MFGLLVKVDIGLPLYHSVTQFVSLQPVGITCCKPVNLLCVCQGLGSMFFAGFLVTALSLLFDIVLPLLR